MVILCLNFNTYLYIRTQNYFSKYSIIGETITATATPGQGISLFTIILDFKITYLIILSDMEFWICILSFIHTLGFNREFGKTCDKKLETQLEIFQSSDHPVSDTDAFNALIQCEGYCKENDLCWGCSVHKSGRQWIAHKECGTKLPWTGKIVGDISQKNKGRILRCYFSV